MKIKTPLVLVFGLVLSMSIPASLALALGNNRTVNRNCGRNYVSSGFNGTDYWAETRRESGSCRGRLSVAFEMNDGRRTARLANNRHSVYDTISPAFGQVRYGLHWGCDNCNLTRT